MAVPFSDLQAVAPSAIIELFVLELNTTQHGANETYRFHAGTSLNANGEVVWAGNNYLRFPVEADGFDYSGQGQLPRPKIRVSNILGTITAILLGLPSGLERAKVTRIRTLARYLDAANFPGAVNPYGTPDPTAEFPREIYYIDRKSAETRDAVEFELAASFDLQGVRAPKRQCIASICQWRYRSAECGYTGTSYFDANDNPVGSSALDVCGKRLTSCEVRFGAPQVIPPNFSTAGYSSTLLSNQTISTNGRLVSFNGWYMLTMQTDGNLVLYDKTYDPKWASNTQGSGATYAIMQSDGNFVVRTASNVAVFATNTLQTGNRLELQGDGNLVVLGSSNQVRWSTGTVSLTEPFYSSPQGVALPFGSFPGVGAYTT
jgi:lambda family phage minor tail protein L